MIDNYNPVKEHRIDVVDLMWKLLMQWKAVLIFCLITGLLISGIKYVKDTKTYKAELENKKVTEEAASKPSDERIADALEALPEADREAVMFYVQMQESAALQQDYLENSILLNENPARQRTLTINYLIKSDSGTSMRTLVQSYNTGLRNDDLMIKLREEISPGSDIEYIYELINNYYGDDVSDYTDLTNATYTVTVVLPEETNAEAVAALIDTEINKLQQDLDAAVGSHEIRKISTEDTHLFNIDADNRKTGILNNINTLNNNMKNAKSSLTPEQLAAVESIISIKRSAEVIEDQAGSIDEEPKAAEFSKKYALLGFILGAFFYVGIYAIILILKKVVASADTAQSYTGTRLLGEVYKTGKHRGLSKLFASAMVAKWRYKDKLDVDKQIDSLVATVDAVCSHHGADKLTFLLTGVGSEFDEQMDTIIGKCRSADKKTGIDMLNADEIEEKTLTSVNDAVYVVSSDSKVDKLSSLMSLVREYDVTSLGTVYLEAL